MAFDLNPKEPLLDGELRAVYWQSNGPLRWRSFAWPAGPHRYHSRGRRSKYARARRPCMSVIFIRCTLPLLDVCKASKEPLGTEKRHRNEPVEVLNDIIGEVAHRIPGDLLVRRRAWSGLR